MKILLTAIIALSLFGCQPTHKKIICDELPIKVECTDTFVRVDTFYRDVRIDTVTIMVENKAAIESLQTRLFVAEYKLGRVQYYLNIALRNPSQDKFLKGWIRRALQ